MLKSLAARAARPVSAARRGALALDAWLRPTAAAKANTEIVVSEARVRNLAQNFRRTWQRPPTREELDGLVESHVREEVFYREALALGLDRDDTIIRRRLQQKIEFISEEAAALAQPTDEELNAYLKMNADAFRVEPRVTFSQIYLDPRKRSSTLDADAKRLLAALNSGSASQDPARLGDRLMMLEPRYERRIEDRARATVRQRICRGTRQAAGRPVGWADRLRLWRAPRQGGIAGRRRRA